MGYYHTAQICKNGHIITDDFDESHEFRQKFCDKCGLETIYTCQYCNAPIRGAYDDDEICYIGTMDTAPSYCLNCGKAFPWTESALEAAKMLINEDENLSQNEKEQFCETLPDLLVTSPTPKTQVASVRFKKFLSKTATYTAEGIRDIFVEVASETIKKSLGL